MDHIILLSLFGKNTEGLKIPITRVIGQLLYCT